MSSYEKIIGDAMLTGDYDLGEARGSCKLMASRHMFCPKCGTILDQKTIHVFELHQRGQLIKAFISCADHVDEDRKLIVDAFKEVKGGELPQSDALKLVELSWSGKTEHKG